MKFNLPKAVKAARSFAANKYAQVGATAMVALSPAAAFAQDAGIGTTVKTLVDEYKEEALVAILAMIVVLWTLKATGVLKPR